jgi:benzil reductase ((S)-benzoin forming)
VQTIFVTGVSRGLGEALAGELLARGCRVVGVGRTSSARLRGERYRFVSCDLSDIAALRGVVMPAFEAVGAETADGVCLINNAATLDPVGVLGAIGVAGIVSSLTVNLIAPVALASLFCEAFADDRCERRIVNVSSGAAQSTLPGESLYCVAKAGLEMLTRSLADERASERFRAITLRPGIIDTDMQKFARGQSKARFPTVDLFKGFHAGNQLVAPEVVARKVVERLVLAPVENGRTYNYSEL